MRAATEIPDRSERTRRAGARASSALSHTAAHSPLSRRSRSRSAKRSRECGWISSTSCAAALPRAGGRAPRASVARARAAAGAAGSPSTTGGVVDRRRRSIQGSAWRAGRSGSSSMLDVVDARRSRVPPATLSGSWSRPITGREAELGGGDREHARARADVQQRRRRALAAGRPAAARGTGGWSRGRPCRMPGPGSITISRTRRRGGSLGAPTAGARCRSGNGLRPRPLRGGAAISTGRWKRRQRSCQSSGISRGRDLDQRAANRRTQIAAAPGARRALRRRRTRRVPPLRLSSSTPAGTSSSSSASTSSACSRADAAGEPDHAAWLPSARRSLANRDSSERRFSSLRVSFRRSSSSRCSSLRRRGTTTLTTTRRSPWRPRLSAACPCRAA